MSLFSNDYDTKEFSVKEDISADFYYRKADEYRKLMKSQLRTFIRTGVIVIAAFIAIIALSMAWFYGTTSVKNTGANVSAYTETLFELATLKNDRAVQGIYDNNTDNNSSLAQSLIHNYAGTYASFQSLPNLSVGSSEYEYENEIYILGNSEGISLMVSNTSNLENVQADQQMGPGSRGFFTFYVISKIDNLNSVTININLDGFLIESVKTADKTGKAVSIMDSSLEDIDKTRLLSCIQGHLLLYQGLDNDGNYCNQLIATQTSECKLLYSFAVVPEEGFQKDVPYPVTLYWIWPKHFDGIIVPGTEESVFTKSCTGQTALINLLNENKDLVFYLKDELQDIKPITEMTNPELTAWSKAYNRGDQLIGNHIAFFEWVIDAIN